MAHVSLRKSFEKGHRRKFMVIIDNTPECEVALAFAGRVAQRTNGTIVLFLVIEPAAFQHWLGVQELKTDNQHQRAQEILQEFREKLSVMGFKGLRTETVIREGAKAEEITKYIERDEDVAILVLAASADKKGPGPLVSSLATGSRAGTFPIPIYLVPGSLSLEEIEALA